MLKWETVSPAISAVVLGGTSIYIVVGAAQELTDATAAEPSDDGSGEADTNIMYAAFALPRGRIPLRAPHRFSRTARGIARPNAGLGLNHPALAAAAG